MATKDAERYIEGIGRRKSAVARVRITPNAKTTYTVNEQSLNDYFPTAILQKNAQAALNELENPQNYTITVHVRGGGAAAQAESVRLGLARALVKEEAERRKELKAKGFLKRDPRIKERKKFGLKKARKAAQWSKR